MNRNDLFVSDLDGTLLTDEGRLSPKSRDKLQQLINSGLNFTVASARSLHTISDLFQGVNFSLPVICLNGAYISDLNTQKHLVINEIQGEVRKKIEEYIKQYGIGVYVSSHHEGTDFLYYNTLNNEGLSWYYNDRITNN
ncbi:MAG: HAD-IIB family hydrolase, partial [Balneolaceae bacterium]|nr:HAD-IIB family hydrolase [Balneolaceae bacterium]